ncbi:hypothetical protein [Micromonospora cathayae]|uniref:Uncharacterized protein n=1 Tax=Micromonospora cathayae TaxID=3028804 RepID=A0ABY7ZQ63_9ACTN|nr:hypothetical protein [Micromonospora sp. HUAS 3]WDZ85145.1 hypothetical protein PVK37_01375 [Micromonospora sp. HUAS 3]
METYIYERPAVLPNGVAPLSAVRVAPVAGLPIPQVHQLQDQAELILAAAPNGIEGTSGFTGKGVDTTTAMKRRLDVRGVPPRGRPV